MPDPQTGDMHQIQKKLYHRSSWHQLAIASCDSMSRQFYRWKFMLTNFIFAYFLFFFWFSNMILFDALILLILQLQTQQSDDVTN